MDSEILRLLARLRELLEKDYPVTITLLPSGYIIDVSPGKDR